MKSIISVRIKKCYFTNISFNYLIVRFEHLLLMCHDFVDEKASVSISKTKIFFLAFKTNSTSVEIYPVLFVLEKKKFVFLLYALFTISNLLCFSRSLAFNLFCLVLTWVLDEKKSEVRVSLVLQQWGETVKLSSMKDEIFNMPHDTF